MRRSGFTMVELIFVIVIIGILAATALPKFSGIRDKAKINSELAALSGLDGAITAASEFRFEDYHDRNVSWHDSDLGNKAGTDSSSKINDYKSVNANKSVLKKIAKKTEGLKIVGFVSSNGDEVNASDNSTPYTNDILFITGPASNAQNGVDAKADNDAKDVLGKPDKNDVWVFNPNNFDINITGGTNAPLHKSPVIIPAQSIALVDVNKTGVLDVEALKAVRNGSSESEKSAKKVE